VSEIRVEFRHDATFSGRKPVTEEDVAGRCKLRFR